VEPAKTAYAAVDYVTLTAVPSPGYVFGGWTGQTEGITDLSQNPVTFAMGDRPDNNRVITANFVQSDIRCGVTATSEPGDGGSVLLYPAQPQAGYPVNQSVSVSAEAQTGYIFSRWAGDLAGSENPRTILVNKDKSFSAIFNLTVTGYCSPSEGGSILVEPESSKGYPAGTDVTITARANKGYRFVSWEGDAVGSDGSITVTVDSPKVITARFAEQTPSRWWMWAILGFAALCGALVLGRLVYARTNRAASDEEPWPEE
jgi:uncharacterized repeat protein (TIGR02543 family)